MVQKKEENELRSYFVPVRLNEEEFRHLEKVRQTIPRSTFLVGCYRKQEKLDGKKCKACNNYI
jgi:hypothetical protein